jgi:hypothetical protein
MHMTPQGPKDPELRYFADHLKRKPEGERYVRRWKQLDDHRRILLSTAKHEQELNALGTGVVQLLRQSYIRLSDACTDALTDLEREYHWPP